MPSDAPSSSTTTPVDWRTVPVPPRLESRPRDHRGFVIPYSVDNGTDRPDFTRVDPTRALEMIRQRVCWLCGGPRTKFMCFIGGPLSIGNRYFNDGWMHEECALYAIRVCPFIANPHGRYVAASGEGEDVNRLVRPTRPDKFGLGYARDFRIAFVAAPGGKQGVIEAMVWVKPVRWFSVWGQEIPASA